MDTATMNDPVFVLSSAFDCEGESPIGVFATPTLAKKTAEARAEELGWPIVRWMQDAGFSWECRYGGSSFIIREELVRTETIDAALRQQ